MPAWKLRPPPSRLASMSSFGSLPLPWLSNGPVILTAKLWPPESAFSAMSSLPDLTSLLPENVSFSSWFTSVLESALSPLPPPQPTSRPSERRAMTSGSRRMGRRLQRTSRRNFEPSIGVLGIMRFACCLFVAIVCSLGAAPAFADDVVVLGRDGTVRHTEDRALPAATMQVPRGHAVATAARNPKKKPKRTVTSELKRLRDAGAITAEDYTAR